MLDESETVEFEVITDSSEVYPDSWQELNSMAEYRQIGLDLYQIRSDTHTIILNEEGFILFKDTTLQGQVIFVDWCRRHNVKPVPRDGINGGD